MTKINFLILMHLVGYFYEDYQSFRQYMWAPIHYGGRYTINKLSANSVNPLNRQSALIHFTFPFGTNCFIDYARQVTRCQVITASELCSDRQSTVMTMFLITFQTISYITKRKRINSNWYNEDFISLDVNLMFFRPCIMN